MTVLSTLPTSPMDPALQGFLAQAAAQGNPPLETLPPPIARQIYRDMAAALGVPAPAVQAEDRQIQGPGGAIALRIYRPQVPDLQTPGPLAPVLYVHGGGYVIGDLETHDTVCRSLCHELGALIVALDYRLAPEHPFPAALDDVVHTLQWLATHAQALGADATRQALAGDSAGAQLAAAACLRTRASLTPRALAMIYPLAQHYSEPSASMVEHEGKFLTQGVIQWFGDSYLANRPDLVRHPEVALLSAPTLAALPPSWVATMGHDPLCDEGHRLAQRIEQAGVPTQHVHYPDGIHACIHFTAISPIGTQVLKDLAQWMQPLLASCPPAPG